jgi:hypothetical protein
MPTAKWNISNVPYKQNVWKNPSVMKNKRRKGDRRVKKYSKYIEKGK